MGLIITVKMSSFPSLVERNRQEVMVCCDWQEISLMQCFKINLLYSTKWTD